MLLLSKRSDDMTARTTSEMQREMDEQSELGNIGAVMDLVDEMGNLEHRALKAIALGNLVEIRHLEARGVDVHSVNGFFYRKAIRSRHLDVVRYFIDRGAGPNSHNGLPLFQAASQGDAVFMLLIEYGADPTTNTASIIEQAAKSGAIDIIKAVIERDQTFRDNGNAVLGFACLFGHFAVVRFLVEEGISSKVSDDIYNAYLDGHRDWKPRNHPVVNRKRGRYRPSHPRRQSSHSGVGNVMKSSTSLNGQAGSRPAVRAGKTVKRKKFSF